MDSFLERYYSALKLGTSLTEYRDKGGEHKHPFANCQISTIFMKQRLKRVEVLKIHQDFLLTVSLFRLFLLARSLTIESS